MLSSRKTIVILLLILSLSPAMSQFIDELWSATDAQWVTCDYSTQPGFTCVDCRTLLQCTAKGGQSHTCSLLFGPYCNSNKCSFTAADGC